ncbi:hypothetical protein M4914_10535 [Streptomyces somaliensis DSM 40738]|uniref:Uncharacterized protein n=1 Tax=Streptomyces somaliensis (strain ATCC 33201 / DSM 40738 / JCM 12659 / KCTC 9044 / NCTC 11332 / NRRL B-12077 / IP 733) TaxID=1134445 RepID=A0AA44DG74_STRE0|nr:hypothetical protein [Streptomyces somaliensis]MCQ0023338.1 hypothetical protein [Streptomyces somaliensis DSM 40738]NKY16039.1 hypothetical protein [Streptomyces somaliensis DSM 40738]
MKIGHLDERPVIAFATSQQDRIRRAVTSSRSKRLVETYINYRLLQTSRFAGPSTGANHGSAGSA